MLHLTWEDHYLILKDCLRFHCCFCAEKDGYTQRVPGVSSGYPLHILRLTGYSAAQAGRRLDDNEPPWKYKAWVTPERIVSWLSEGGLKKQSRLEIWWIRCANQRSICSSAGVGVEAFPLQLWWQEFFGLPFLKSSAAVPHK